MKAICYEGLLNNVKDGILTFNSIKVRRKSESSMGLILVFVHDEVELAGIDFGHIDDLARGANLQFTLYDGCFRVSVSVTGIN